MWLGGITVLRFIRILPQKHMEGVDFSFMVELSQEVLDVLT
jgi:hypothetical protein